MKTSVALLGSLALASLTLAQTTSSGQGTTVAQPPPPAGTAKAKTPRIELTPEKKAPATKAGAEKAGAAKGATAAKDAKAGKDAKKDEAPAKIEGMEIPRGPKGFLGLEIVDGKFKLTFYDAKKKPTAPDVARAALRWDPKYKVGMERAILTPGGGANSMTSEKPIRPPYNFKLWIVLLKDASDSEDPVGETHVIDFRG